MAETPPPLKVLLAPEVTGPGGVMLHPIAADPAYPFPATWGPPELCTTVLDYTAFRAEGQVCPCGQRCWYQVGTG